jgi:hypothetical protein
MGCVGIAHAREAVSERRRRQGGGFAMMRTICLLASLCGRACVSQRPFHPRGRHGGAMRVAPGTVDREPAETTANIEEHYAFGRGKSLSEGIPTKSS